MGKIRFQEYILWVPLVSKAFAFKPGVSPQLTETATGNKQAGSWLNQLIQELDQTKPANPLAKIYRYTNNIRKYIT